MITCWRTRLFGPARAFASGPPFSPIHVRKQNFVLTDSESPVVIRKKANNTFVSKYFSFIEVKGFLLTNPHEYKVVELMSDRPKNMIFVAYL